MEKFLGIAQTIFEDPKSFLTALGAAIVVVALAGGVPPYLSIPAGSNQQALLAAFGAALAIVGIYLVFGAGASGPHGVVITDPEPNAPVERELKVTGNVRKSPNRKELWLVRIYDDERYTPVQKVFVGPKDRKWNAKFNLGTGIKIGAFMVGEEGQALFTYWREAADRHSALLVQQKIPDDVPNRYLPAFNRDTVKALKITECSVIRVTRKY